MVVRRRRHWTVSRQYKYQRRMRARHRCIQCGIKNPEWREGFVRCWKCRAVRRVAAWMKRVEKGPMPQSGPTEPVDPTRKETRLERGIREREAIQAKRETAGAVVVKVEVIKPRGKPRK